MCGVRKVVDAEGRPHSRAPVLMLTGRLDAIVPATIQGLWTREDLKITRRFGDFHFSESARLGVVTERWIESTEEKR